MEMDDVLDLNSLPCEVQQDGIEISLLEKRGINFIINLITSQNVLQNVTCLIKPDLFFGKLKSNNISWQKVKKHYINTDELL